LSYSSAGRLELLIVCGCENGPAFRAENQDKFDAIPDDIPSLGLTLYGMGIILQAAGTCESSDSP
jgi:hypothetical protein